ncbi:MAG: signal transduction protein [Idiomarina sp.]|uniref:Hpt domain-containing protein n=1 Tax=Idiomarina sp. TaxID=1874361 RepID=UPI000C363BAB|nr:Hpt domain-containing protein [Idiomarina sp.]MBR38203.1 signal transduction protein [Idiomarina sp.]|tara:strand:- start:47 stop:394 length:348 start_codon:yes stop_codon:yes gene_type:complete
MNEMTDCLMNFQRGLRHCDGQVNIYQAVLKAFCEQYANRLCQHHSIASDGLYQELHALKGLSATIGAQSLSELTESAFKNWTRMSDESRIKALDSIQFELSKVLDEIKEYLTQNN